MPLIGSSRASRAGAGLLCPEAHSVDEQRDHSLTVRLVLATNVTLDRIAGRGITHLGGSILGNSSRGDPFKLPRPPQ